MTKVLASVDVAGRLRSRFPSAVVAANPAGVRVRPESIPPVARFLRDDPDLRFDYLSLLNVVDYLHYFEVVYHLYSIRHNHSVVLRSRIADRERPSLPSVTPIWRGADLQEREMYDLMGVVFEGHPNLKRLLLWDGFQGHPQRKDYI